MLLRPSDLVIANDAAALPASLRGTHAPTGREIEVRLAVRTSLSMIRHVVAVVFGQGDFRVRTEDRPRPPALHRGDRLRLGPLRATVMSLAHHPRLVLLHLDGTADDSWLGLAQHGRPCSTPICRNRSRSGTPGTPIAGPAVAFEPPSAGCALSWGVLDAARGGSRVARSGTRRRSAHGTSTRGNSAPLERYFSRASSQSATDLSHVRQAGCSFQDSRPCGAPSSSSTSTRAPALFNAAA